MERLRHGLLFGAACFAGVHLIPWCLLALLSVPDLFRRGGDAMGGTVLLLVLPLGALGVVALVIPVKAMASRGRWTGAALIASGILYAVLAWSGFSILLSDTTPAMLLGGLEAWLVWVPLVLGSLVGGAPFGGAVVAGAYAGALLLAGLLSLRSEAGPGA